MLFRSIAFLVSLMIAAPVLAAGKSYPWANVKCCGTDIAVGKDASVWLVGSDKRLYRWNGANWIRDPQAGGVVRVAAAPDGTPWITNTNADIWTKAGGKWTKIQGKATDIAVGADGTVWTLGRQGAIYKRQDGKWVQVSGKARRIAVDPKGNAWVVNAGGLIYRYDGRKFVKMPGANGNDIGIGADGSPWLTIKNGNIYRWEGKSWVHHKGKLVSLSVGPDGSPWGVASDRKVFTSKSALASVQASEQQRRRKLSLGEALKSVPKLVTALENISLTEKGTHAEWEGEVFGQKTKLIVYTPKGKSRPNIALSFATVDIGGFLKAADLPNLIPFQLNDLILFFVPPGNDQDGIAANDLPAILKTRANKVLNLSGGISGLRFDLEPGMNFLSRVDATKRPDVNSLVSVIGLKDLNDLTVTGRLTRLAIKKHKPWQKPFGMNGVTIDKGTIQIITTRASDFFGTAAGAALDFTRIGKPYYRNVSIWGNTRVDKRDYLVFGQQSLIKKTPASKPAPVGTAWGFDAKEITLKDAVNLAKRIGWNQVLPSGSTGKMPLDKIALGNPNHSAYNALSYTPPPFHDMILVSGTAGSMLPDGKPLPGTNGIPGAKKLSGGLSGTPGPLLYVNASMKLDGKSLGNTDISLSARGLRGEAAGRISINTKKVLGKSAKLVNTATTSIELSRKKMGMEVKTTLDVSGFAKRNATISFAPAGAKFSVDFGCAPPLKIESFLQNPSQPWNSIDDLLLGVSVNHSASYRCAGKVFQFVGGTLKNMAAKISGGAKVTAQAIANATKYTFSKIGGGAGKVAGKIKSAFGGGGSKAHRPSKRGRDSCGTSPDHRWVREFGQCWKINYKYLYLVRNAQGAGFCLQVDGARNNNGTAAEFGNCDMNWTQQWKFDNGKIVNAEGKCLDADKNAAMGAKVQIWSCHGRSNQQWKVKDGKLANANGYCVGGAVGHGHKLKIVPCGSMSGVIGWAAMAAPVNKTPWANGAKFQIRSKAFGTCLDIQHRDRRLKTWKCDKKNVNQQFLAEGPYGTGPYWMKIKSVKYNRCYRFRWDIRQKDPTCASQSHNNEVWKLFWQTDGSYCIHNLDQVRKKKALVAMEIRAKGNNQLLVLAPNKCNWNQRFYIEPVN